MITKADAESAPWRRLPIRQRYLWWALNLFADDDGILPVYLIPNRIFFPGDAYSDTDLLQDLSDLEVTGFIKLYTANEDQYVHISRWWDKQFIDLKLYRETTYPRPPDYKPRPPDLKKYHTSSVHSESSRTTLEQKRKDEASTEKIKSVQTISEKGIGRKRDIDPADDLPFDENGNARY